MDFITNISFFLRLFKKSAFLSLILLFAGAAYAETEPAWAPRLLGMQATIIYQNMPAFHSPYEGPQSLRFEDGKGQGHTETYSISIGSRITSFLQAYLDIEQARGNGIGNAVGLAGITDGDMIRRSSTDQGSDPYIARGYIRCLISLSGDTATVERGMDQMPGAEPVSRIEIKAGKMAATDDFDLNRYANTTRTQFMNWGLINNTAWDFDADTRGYSYGIYLAMVKRSWRLALGAYQMPTTANGSIFDGHLGQAHGENLEMTIKPNQQGTVLRFLVYRNLARMGNIAEAISIGRTNSTTPDITADEQYGRSKYGFGLNGEQPLADDGETGLFFRIGWNDGHTEEFAFTEVDQHLSAGVQVSGGHWGRTDDRLGIAYAGHGLSPEHRAYLDNGGSGFLLGDGRLNYGSEQILETYYRVQLGQYAQVSPDFQYIRNPGYNHDRGPVEVYSMRLHLSY